MCRVKRIRLKYECDLVLIALQLIYKRVIGSRVSTRRRKCLTNGVYMKFKSVLSLVLGLILVTSTALAGERFPTEPIESVTPGSLCEDSPIRRYPEGIVYCERDVDTQLKRDIIKMYDERFGFSIRQMNRMDFKIDHFIPLSLGGSNDIENLWPQHKSVYEVTDELEHLLSRKISSGAIKQVEAVRVIKEAKHNLDRVPELMHYVEGLE